jgi:hypothetical protein
MSDLVRLYNPANAAALTSEQIAGLQKLTNDQIKELAKAYPNATMQRAYLLIIDSRKPVNKQLPTLSSFENLYNLRTKNSMTSFVAFNFKGNKAKPAAIVRGRKPQVLDLQDMELKDLPGFKTEKMTIPEFKTANTVIPETEVSVKKVGRPKKTKSE